MNEETKKIRETRKKLGLSTKQMAVLLGVAKGTLEYYEQGRKIPKPVMMHVDRLDVTTQDEDNQ